MRTVLKFKDFTSKENYCKLQESFQFMDYRSYHFEKINEPLNDITIILNNVNFEGEEEFEEKSFIDDFIKSNIDGMFLYVKDKFLNEIYSKSLLTKELRAGLAEKFLSNKTKALSLILNAEYLTKELISSLEEQLDLIEQFISEYLADPYPEVKRKIQFKWNRTDVIYFFHLLRENKEISEISNANLGRIIDIVCECFNNDAFVAIKGSSKHLSDFKTTSGRSETKAIERLRGVFNSDFFNV